MAAIVSDNQAGPSTSSFGADDAGIRAEVFKRLHPDEYISRFVAQGYRPDGRKLDGWRDVSVNVGSVSTADGSALIRMGDTTMVCGIKAEIAEPDSARPNEGFIIPNIDLPALCSPRFKPGPPVEDAQVYSNQLHDLLISSRTIPLSSLCIAPRKAVWALYIDVVCINYDGNAFDAAVLAVIAALRSTTLPAVRHDEESGRTRCTGPERHPLPLGSLPLSCSFGIFQSTFFLPDPTALETPLLPTTLVIALDEGNKACLVRHEGKGGMNGQTGERVIDQAWSAAEERIKEIRRILDESTGS